MYVSFASSDGRAVLVLGAAANSTTSIVVALDGHLQTFATIVVVARNGFSISCLAHKFALGFVGLERIERF